MRRVLSEVTRSVAVLALLVFGAAGQAAAGPLNPLDFTSLGAFPAPRGRTPSTPQGRTPR